MGIGGRFMPSDAICLSLSLGSLWLCLTVVNIDVPGSYFNKSGAGGSHISTHSIDL